MVSPQSFSEKEAYDFAARYCSGQERCKAEVVQKLKSFDVSEDIINQIIEKLCQEKYLDDKRFAKAFVHDKLRFNKWGRIKLSMALRQKGVEESVANAALKEIDQNEYLDILKEELDKKAKFVKGANKEVTKKLFQFALSRGFESYVIQDVLSMED
ncbi:MAG TPA: regulatory protein RecX [Bacteroidales bacterium]|nr:regulatory protein RecX [Bacteroidales bacterium]